VETQGSEVRKLGRLEAVGIVQLLHEVMKRLELKGYRPIRPTDKLKLGQTLLRVEVWTYYMSATVNTDLDKAPGVRFAPLRKSHLTTEGLERLRRIEYDHEDQENNEIRWFIKDETPRR
jgi:hypothetical protein